MSKIIIFEMLSDKTQHKHIKHSFHMIACRLIVPKWNLNQCSFFASNPAACPMPCDDVKFCSFLPWASLQTYIHIHLVGTQDPNQNPLDLLEVQCNPLSDPQR
eukprot:c23643_g1_i1 orf=575-883(-)